MSPLEVENEVCGIGVLHIEATGLALAAHTMSLLPGRGVLVAGKLLVNKGVICLELLGSWLGVTQLGLLVCQSLGWPGGLKVRLHHKAGKEEERCKASACFKNVWKKF